VSSVHLALRLEAEGEGADARTLMSLLAWRSERDVEEEVRQVYGLATMKLKFSGVGSCHLCAREFDVDTLGVLETEEELEEAFQRGEELPFAIPKIIVPPCGHAVHSICWCTRLVASDREGEDRLGYCKECTKYTWYQIDTGILQKVFTFVFSEL